jgi:hypothetical protein
MLNKIGILSALGFALSGCSMKLPPRHITFEPTNSACLDALTANFAYAKCKDIEEEGSWGEQLRIYCKNPKKETQWAMRSYYVITTYWGGYAPEDAIPLCADEGLILFYKDGLEY